jgi:hypothetical protein
MDILKELGKNASFVIMKKLLQLVFALLLFPFLGEEVAAGIPARKLLPDERIFGWTLLKTGGGWPCDPGAVWLNAGTSFGLLNYPIDNLKSSIMPIQLSADYSFKPHFAAGIYAGFNQLTYADIGKGYTSRLRSIKYGVRILMHGSDLLCDAFGFHFDTRVIDLYIGASAGIDRRTWDYRYTGSSSFKNEDQNNMSGQLGLFLGARYIFKQRAGLFVEMGKGNFGWFNAGFTIKIR